MTRARTVSGLAALLLVVLVLAACGGDGKESPTATAERDGTAVIGTAVTEGPLDISGSTATDGVCKVTIPDTWADDGTGQGATSQGDKWRVFGNRIADDAAWNAARDLLKAQMSSQPGAKITEDDRTITVELPNGRGYVHRERFNDRYCEISVMANRDEPEQVMATWLAVAATLAADREP
jgi:hypothetical protein